MIFVGFGSWFFGFVVGVVFCYCELYLIVIVDDVDVVNDFEVVEFFFERFLGKGVDVNNFVWNWFCS